MRWRPDDELVQLLPALRAAAAGAGRDPGAQPARADRRDVVVAAVHRAARVVRRRLAAETGTDLRACRAGRRARGRAGAGAREGTGIALLALPRADPRQGPLRAPVAPRREGDGRAGAAAREAARGRDAARHRGAVRILQADAVSALEARADRELQLPGLGEPVQARRGRLLPARRALRRESVPDLRLERARAGRAG